MTTNSMSANGFANQPNSTPHAEPTVLGLASPKKSKDSELQMLMEKLRSKVSGFKPLAETAKSIRMAMLDKRFGLDSVEKSQLQKSLDMLQHSIKVTTLQSMIERLESLSRQLGLKFMMTNTSNGPSTELFISSDMFYLEIILEPSGVVRDVKIHHEGKAEEQSCEELVSCLSKGDFVDFTAQLEGLASIYQLNADKKVKCKAFSALQSLETDLEILAQTQTFIKEPFNLVHKCPVGILEKRKGGHAMKLTYFVSPYDLIDIENKTCEPLSLEAVISKKVGHSVTVCMEGSTAHRLPTSSIITVDRSPTGISKPDYAVLMGSNSSMLPACFVLKLSEKMPICLELLRRIQKDTDLECTDISAAGPLLSMIVQHASDKQLDCKNNKGLSVSLPDQQHCYFMTENSSMQGVLVGSIPFTHPAHVPKILVHLRQQALFNTLISSCVRPMARHEFNHTTTILEVSALSWQCISVSLEHPFEETLATAELDLSGISALKCKLYGVNANNSEKTSELAGKVLQRCLSIPLTMRTLIKAWEGRTYNLNSTNTNGNFNGGLGSNGRPEPNNGQPPQHNGTSNSDFMNGEIKIKQEPTSGGMNGGTRQHQQLQNIQQQQSFLDAGAENSIGFPAFSGVSDTTTSSTSSPGLSTGSQATGKKVRKQKSETSSLWKSAKREPGEILMDSSSLDSTPLGTPKEEARTPTPTSTDSSNVDTTDSSIAIKNSDVDSTKNDIVTIDTSIERKIKKEKLTSSVLEDTKALVSPSVSITPVTNQSAALQQNLPQGSQQSNYTAMLSSMGLERRPGIEIIPITSISQAQLPSSITITAITNPNKPPSSSSSSSSTSSSSTTSTVGDDRSKDRKSSKSSSSGSSSSSSSSSSRSLEEKIRLEKKRKRKHESSSPSMGPPEKLPFKQQDSISKPASISIKPAESPPTSRPTSPAMANIRKYSSSPSGMMMMGKSSPTPGLKQSPVGAGKPSPKHSPVYSSSPKHMSSMPPSSSPKSISSPKHGNSGSSGKPSMSTLKSASSTSSGSSKSDGTKTKAPSGMSSSTSASSSSSSLSTSGLTLTPVPSSSSTLSSTSSSLISKDKDRKPTMFGSSSPGHQSPKSKSSVPKVKTPETEQGNGSRADSSTPPADPNKSSINQQQAQARNRKGSLSAVIENLKLKHSSDESTVPSGSGATPAPTASVPGAKTGETKNPTEYMVKPSSDGIKLTINKTRTKDMKSNSSSSKLSQGNPSTSASTSSGGSGNGSPKLYTGLKHGVSSGPSSSKKPMGQTLTKVRSSSPLVTGSSRSSMGGPKLAKANPGSSLLSSGSSSFSKSASSKGFSTLAKVGALTPAHIARAREKARFKSGEKSSGSKENESDKPFKLMPAHVSLGSGLSALPGFPSQLVEGLVKTLDTKFQIPKISARVNAAESADKRSVDKVDSGGKSSASKSTELADSDVPTNLSMQMNDRSKIESSQARQYYSGSNPSTKDAHDGSSGCLNLSKSSDNKKPMEPLPSPSVSVPAQNTPPTTSQEAAEMLLDFSTPKESSSSSSTSAKQQQQQQQQQQQPQQQPMAALTYNPPPSSSPLRKNATPPPPPPPPPPLPPPLPPPVSAVSPLSFPQSPSVSLHIVKSPAPSPRVIPLSPHSASPCITDDELMDEALVGS